MSVLKQIDIVLPVYNEERVLPAFHAALVNTVEKLAPKYSFHIVYVLDPCSDNSFELLRGIHDQYENVTVIQLSRRFGHQMSLIAGIDQSRADALIMMDCDLQHPPEIIPEMLRKFEEGYDIVQTIRKYDAGSNGVRGLLSRCFYKLQNLLSPIEIKDGAADFRLISQQVARVFQDSIREQNQFLRGLFQWVGFRTAYLSFESLPRAAGRTKYDLLRLLTFSIEGITSFSKIPLRIATLMGLAFSIMSAAYGLWLVTLYFRVGHFPPGYTSIIVILLGIGGLQMTVLGILGEYIGSIFDEVKARPLYIVKETLPCRLE